MKIDRAIQLLKETEMESGVPFGKIGCHNISNEKCKKIAGWLEELMEKDKKIEKLKMINRELRVAYSKYQTLKMRIEQALEERKGK